jgi:hypothetical protein
MIYEIHPLVGVNDIKFDMSPDDVRSRMSGNFETFVWGGNLGIFKDSFPTDYYQKEGILCFYDKSGRMDGMQFYEPSRPVFRGVNLLSLSIGQAMRFLRQWDPDLKNYGGHGGGAISRRLNLVVRSFDMDEDDSIPVESVETKRAGYFDYLDEYQL